MRGIITVNEALCLVWFPRVWSVERSGVGAH